MSLHSPIVTAPLAPAPRRLVAPALVVAVLAISLAAPLFRMAAPTHPLVAAGGRLAIAAVALSPWVLRASIRRRLTTRAAAHAALAGLLYAVHFGAWVASLGLTSVAASVTIVTATPLLLALVGLITGRDRPSARHGAALLLAAAGLWLIVREHGAASGGELAGDALALLGAAAMAGFLLTARRLGTELDAWVFSGIAAAIGAAALLGAATVAGLSLAPPSVEAFACVALAALLPQLVGHTLLTWVLKHRRPIIVALATLGEAVGATLLTAIWLGEVVTPVVALGCLVTLGGVVVSLLDSD